MSNYAEQVLIGSRQIGLISFIAISNRPSAFVPLTISDVVATKSDGTTVTNVVVGTGRVVVIGAEPLLEAYMNTNGQPAVVFYGQPNASHYLLSASSPTQPVVWTTNQVVLLTNFFQVIAPIANTNQTMFFRGSKP